ncbi:MAG: inositol monophosphatase family protein [Acidimicrobiia bacterium]
MDDLEVATRAARAGADVIRAAAGELRVRMKGSVDPVTHVDIAAEQAVLDAILRARPADGILAEESGRAAGSLRMWVVDPLDGTVNFIHGLEHVAVSVALWVEGEPVVGVVIDVPRDRLYAAEAGAGAEVDGEPLSVTSTDPANAVIATGFPYDRRERAETYGAMVGRLLGRTRAVRRYGSAALDLAWVAEGRFDGYVETGLQPWDVAAGILLVREAGGVVLDHQCRPAGLRSPAIAAGGESVARALSELVAPAV